MNHPKSKLTIVLLVSMTSLAYSQTDTTKVDTKFKMQRVDLLIDNQINIQENFKKDSLKPKERVFGSIGDITSAKRESNKALKDWFNNKLDAIHKGDITNLTIEDLEMRH